MLDGEQQGSFFTGLSNRRGTKPGFKLDNETFILTFEAVQCENVTDSQRQFVRDRFESCYDWSQVMNIVLECLEYYYDEGDFQIDAEHSVAAWLREYSGWGLLFTLLPMDFQKFLLVLYSHLNVKYSEEEIVKTNEELFEDLISMYESETQGLPLHDLVPKVHANLLNVVGGPRECERKKMLKVVFNSSRFQLIVNFRVEKKRLRRTLVEHCAEIIGRIVDDAEDLEIPETLKPAVSDKIVDADWIAGYWFAKYKVGQAKQLKEAEAGDEEEEALGVRRRDLVPPGSSRRGRLPPGTTVFSYLIWSFRDRIVSFIRNLIFRNS